MDRRQLLFCLRPLGSAAPPHQIPDHTLALCIKEPPPFHDLGLFRSEPGRPPANKRVCCDLPTANQDRKANFQPMR
jgi:hypothetical protein